MGESKPPPSRVLRDFPRADEEPPEAVTYSLQEALTLLAALEDARDALIESDRLAVVVIVENEIRLLGRRLGFDDDPPGGTDVQ